MLNKVRVVYQGFLNNITWRDIVIFTTIVLIANEWYSIIALLAVFIIELALFYVAFDFIPLLRTRLVFYGGIRKQVIQNLSIFSNAVGCKMIYLVSSNGLSNAQLFKLMLQIVLLLIIVPTFMNFILRWDSVS